MDAGSRPRPLRVVVLAAQPPGRAPNQRFRFEQWFRLLPAGAVDLAVLPLFEAGAAARLHEPGGTFWKVGQTAAGLLRRLRQLPAARAADVVLIPRELFPLGPALIEAYLERRVPVVFDFDDAVFLRDASEANRLAAWLKMPGKTAGVIAGAAATTAGNEYLASYARRFSSSVHVIPTTLDVETYRPPPRPSCQPGDRVRVGWSGSPTTSKHLRSIAPALRRLLADHPVELVVIGDPSFRLEGAPNVTVLPWRSSTEIADVGSFDIGLMPLPDDEWSRGKCGFKALLYMALGVPAVVSPVGVNTEIVSDGDNGLLASTNDDWVAAIARLVEDPALRERLGAAGRQRVVDRYSGQQWAPRFLEILRAAAG
jgi:glycosyltransferase involved in cell wall biosynthesis